MNSMSSHCSIFLHSIIIRKKIEENINRARDLSTYGFDEYSSYLQRNLEASNRKIGTVQFVTSVNLFNLPCDPPVRRKHFPSSRPVSNFYFRRIYPSAHNMYVFGNLSLCHGDNSFGENLRIFPCYLSPYPSWSNSALLTRAFSIVIRISFTKIRISLFFLFNIRTEE